MEEARHGGLNFPSISACSLATSLALRGLSKCVAMNLAGSELFTRVLGSFLRYIFLERKTSAKRRFTLSRTAHISTETRGCFRNRDNFPIAGEKGTNFLYGIPIDFSHFSVEEMADLGRDVAEQGDAECISRRKEAIEMPVFSILRRGTANRRIIMSNRCCSRRRRKWTLVALDQFQESNLSLSPEQKQTRCMTQTEMARIGSTCNLETGGSCFRIKLMTVTLPFIES